MLLHFINTHAFASMKWREKAQKELYSQRNHLTLSSLSIDLPENSRNTPQEHLPTKATSGNVPHQSSPKQRWDTASLASLNRFARATEKGMVENDELYSVDDCQSTHKLLSHRDTYCYGAEDTSFSMPGEVSEDKLTLRAVSASYVL